MNTLIIIAIIGFGIAFYGQSQSDDKNKKDDKIENCDKCSPMQKAL